MIDFIKDKIVFEEYKARFLQIFDIQKTFEKNPFNKNFKYFLAFEYEYIQHEHFFEYIKVFLKKIGLDNFIYYTTKPQPDEDFYTNYGIYSAIRLYDYHTDEEFSHFLMAGDSILYSSTEISLFSDSDEWAVATSIEFEIAIIGFTSHEIKDLFLASFGDDANMFFSIQKQIEIHDEMFHFKEEVKEEYLALINVYADKIL